MSLITDMQDFRYDLNPILLDQNNRLITDQKTCTHSTLIWCSKLTLTFDNITFPYYIHRYESNRWYQKPSGHVYYE